MNDKPTLAAIAKAIDHSLLHPALTDAGIRDGCRIAWEHTVATVCGFVKQPDGNYSYAGHRIPGKSVIFDRGRSYPWSSFSYMSSSQFSHTALLVDPDAAIQNAASSSGITVTSNRAPSGMSAFSIIRMRPFLISAGRVVYIAPPG